MHIKIVKNIHIFNIIELFQFVRFTAMSIIPAHIHI